MQYHTLSQETAIFFPFPSRMAEELAVTSEVVLDWELAFFWPSEDADQALNPPRP